MPLFALIIIPSLVGVLLISSISWRLFGPAVEKSSEVALSVMEEMIKTTGSEALRYPLAVGDEESIKRIVAAMASNDLVFAVQVEDAEGDVVARAQNSNLPIEEGIRLIEYREKLFIEAAVDGLFEDEVGDKTVYVGMALYQLSPHVLTKEKERLVSEFRAMIVVLLLLGLLVILMAMRILWKSVSSITHALGRIAEGESGVEVSSDPFVSEFDVITRGVNQLSTNLDIARDRQGRAVTELEEAVERAVQSDRETRSFYEMATREIAKPVMQVVELLKLNQKGGSEQVDPQLILDNAERVKLSVLAMLGKLSDARGEEVENEIELGDYFDLLEGLYRPRFEVKRLGYFVEAKGSAEQAKYKIDVRTLDVVLEKLLENSLKFTPEGEVRVHWRVIKREGSEDLLTITVRDNGLGIEAENLERVFERYSHFELEEGAHPGSGLGLYIARELIQRQGGSLEVVSQAGVGSEFTVELPIQRGGKLIEEKYDVKGKIALIVGSSDNERHVLEDYLSHYEMVNLHSDTAIEALTVLAEHEVDVLLVDESIEDIDVDGFVPEARKRQENMYIVVLSENDADEDEDYTTIRKPLGKAEVIELLRRMTIKRSSGVDYRLIERLEAKKGKGKT
ncbi:ATP-binding protein [Pseudohalioglobus lutimaris]|uniref:histidine kinase n=1 Tax=Pseudohalioglobus lutimaris TaxID=1737061 RepID=A0A2N5WZV5_9GAMM|nr:ATP-binding protein [Pseudohalioglobus lutimaris]PLW67785.1 hypothetical protein C0039_15315 [Pseudohalioglobus lutimaris]